ncbi:alpha/beta fold hydrolase [Mycolicibacterium sp.]|uniref:alpha/beta fold hydrolase n=1 Tax=Mycolicibacterium sp. TaxID=2320850 RepID=UPI0037C50739
MEAAALLGRAHFGFKSADARQHYLELYEELRGLSPPDNAVHDIPTKFGAVRVCRHGRAGGVPIVLLRGYLSTSAMWAHQVTDLAGNFTVYTIDMPGQAGASMQSRSLRTPDYCARCIENLFDGLDLTDVVLVGHSYGSWIATHSVAHLPERLSTMTLTDPASTVARLSARF